MKIAAIHEFGPWPGEGRPGTPPCHGVAFYFTERPHLHGLALPGIVEMADGRRPIAGERMICGACGKPIMPYAVFPEGGWSDSA
jgi:hypothetical protein